MKNFARFNRSTQLKKPVTIRNDNSEVSCPFCDFNALKERQRCLIEFEENSLLVENLYPTIQNGYQTVFIETPDCDASILSYDRKTLCNVFKNYFHSYQYLADTRSFPFIAAFKNYGMFSSGTIHHQHMQLIGFDDIYEIDVPDEHFTGVELFKNKAIDITLSDNPLNEFFEINLSIKKDVALSFDHTFEEFCLLLQKCCIFTVDKICSTASFNLIFYFNSDDIKIKILPRVQGRSYLHSPLFLGYRIKQISSDLLSVASDLSSFLKQ